MYISDFSSFIFLTLNENALLNLSELTGLPGPWYNTQCLSNDRGFPLYFTLYL